MTGERRSKRGAASGAWALAALWLVVLGLFGPPARAATSPWSHAPHVEARLLSAVGATGQLGRIEAGLEVKLEGDWKTYWRSPGDAGLPPTLDWRGSDNLARASLAYPAPARLTVLGIETFGYKHDVVFPLDLTPTQPGRPLDLKLHLDLLVCETQCVPESLDLALALPAGPATPDTEAQILARARESVPSDTRRSGLSIRSAQEVSADGAPALEVVAHAEPAFQSPDLIAELKPDANLGASRIALSADRHEATFDLPLTRRLPVGAHLTGRAATFTLTDGPRALEQSLDVTQGASARMIAAGPSLSGMLLVALLGGLILNLMPCVLPVLSLKLYGIVSQGGRAPAEVRAGFLATAAGIVVSFLVIAGALALAKAAGHVVGWGLQFQEPLFITTLAVVVTFFAAQVAGFVDVPLPRALARAASGRAGPDESLAGHFLTGAFATLLATPCSAPFLGTAVAFALAGGTGVIFGIFLALGMGLAAPYLLVAAMPRLATRLPKPGAWMERVKQALALPLLATAVWLLAILAAQRGMTTALAVGGALAAFLVALAASRRLPARGRAAALGIAGLAAVSAVVVPKAVGPNVGLGGAIDDAIAWKPFDRDAIRSLVSQGKTVFVDVTADWCLTCQANRRFVLAQPDVARRLDGPIVAMQADWTRPDPAISAYLASYGRYGIPFNIVYGPSAPGGLVLPELLTREAVTGALDKASGVRAALAP